MLALLSHCDSLKRVVMLNYNQFTKLLFPFVMLPLTTLKFHNATNKDGRKTFEANEIKCFSVAKTEEIAGELQKVL